MWMTSRGALDPGFDGDGMATTAFGTGADTPYGVAVQTDGRIVVAGTALIGANNDVAVARYLTSGAPDPSFDGDGKVTTTVAAATDEARAVAVQSDGKIVVAGYAASGTVDDFTVLRYTTSGALDPTFDGDGIATTSFGAGSDQGRALAIQADGKIVVAGYSNIGGSDNDFAVARYNADGSLDTTFDTDGRVTVGFTAGQADQVRDVDVDASGRIIVSGYAYNGANNDFALMRLLTNGALDTTFDGDGRVVTDFASLAEQGRSLEIQPDGKLLLGGYSRVGTTDDFAVVRYTNTGALDASFASGGKLTVPVGAATDQASGISLQPDGTVVLAGYSFNGTRDNFALVRITSDGTVDTRFGTNGVSTYDAWPGASQASAVTLETDGRLVATGTVNNGSNNDFGVIRTTSPQVIPDYLDDGTADWDTVGPTALFGVCLRSATGGASAGAGAWTAGPAATCPATDGSFWNAIPATQPGSKVAFASTSDAQGGGSDPTVNLRFGFRSRPDQFPGTYVAPIVFTVVAPNV